MMNHDAIHEIAKGLTDEQEDSLLAHAAVSVSKALETASPEEAQKHASSFLFLVRAMDPEGFEGGAIDFPDDSLEKDATDETSWQSHLKDLMHEQGHHYFGSLEKHYWGEQGTGPGKMDVRGYGPHGAKNPKKSPTHSYKKPQEVHGRGSGKRTLMGYIRAYAKKHGDEDVASWNDMKAMSHEEVIEIADDLGVLVETRGERLRVVDTDGSENEEGENKLRGRDIANYVGAPKRGAGKNVTQDSAARHIDHIENENDKLDGMGRKKPNVRDEKRRAFLPRRKNKTAKEKLVEVGRRRYGAHDPNETLDTQPKGNRLAEEAERKRMKEQRERTLRVSPKVHERDLPDAPRESDKKPLPKLPDANDAGEHVDRGDRRAKVPEGDNRSMLDRLTGRKAKPEVEAEKPKNFDSPTRRKLETLDAEGKVEEYKRLVTNRKRLKDRIASLKQNGSEVPKVLERQYNKAQKQFIVANGALRRDEGVDRNQLRRLREAIEQGRTPAGEKPIKDSLAQPQEWRKPKETAQRILAEVDGGWGDLRGATFDGSKLTNLRQDHKSGFYVSEKGAEKIIQGTPTVAQIEDYLKANRAKLQNGGLFGMWNDNGVTHLDVSRHFDTKDEARDFGRDNDQLAVYDIARRRDITPTMPDDLSDDLDPARSANMAATARELDRQAKEFHTMIEAIDSRLFVNEQPDRQQNKLYKAEGPHLRGEAGNPLPSLDAMQKRADEITNSDWWKKTFPNTPRVIISGERSEPGSGADAARHIARIRFNGKKASLTEGILIHEMAHTVTSMAYEGHGPEYARNHIEMVRQFRGDKIADAMLASYAEVGVKVSDLPAGHFLPSADDLPAMNRLSKLRTRLSISLAAAQKNGDSELVSQIRQQRDMLNDQIQQMGIPKTDHDSAKAKLKNQQARLNGKKSSARSTPTADGVGKAVTVPKNFAGYVGGWRAYYETAQEEAESDGERKLSARMVEKLSMTGGSEAAKLNLTAEEAESLADTIEASIDDVRNHLEDNVSAGTKGDSPAEAQAAKAHAELQNQTITAAQHASRLNRIATSEEGRLRKLAAQIRGMA